MMQGTVPVAYPNSKVPEHYMTLEEIAGCARCTAV